MGIRSVLLASIVIGTLLAPLLGQKGASGWVRDPDGRPVANAEVRLLGGLRRQAERDVLDTTRTGEDGRFSFPSEPGGTILMTADAEPYAMGALLLNSADARHGLEVNLRHGRPARGVVIDAVTGKPIVGARVAFEDYPPVFTDVKGLFVFRALPQSSDNPVLGVSTEGYVTQDIDVPLNAERLTFLANMVEGEEVLVRVTDLEGQPLEGARVTLRQPTVQAYSNQERMRIHGVTNGEGSVSLKGVPRGAPVCAEVEHDGYVIGQSPVFLAIREEGVINGVVQLGKGCALDVTIVDEFGDLIPEAEAFVRPLVEPLLDFGGGVERDLNTGPIQHRSSADGEILRFDQLPAGFMTLELRAPGHLTQMDLIHLDGSSGQARYMLEADPNPPVGSFPWCKNLNEAFERADATGRPIMFSMSMDGERANDWMARHHFHDLELERVARELPLILTNVFGAGSPIPHARGIEHTEEDGACTRYGHIRCASHQADETYCVENFIGAGVPFQVPQQIFLMPDGRVIMHRTYYLSIRDWQRMMLRALRFSDPDCALRLARERLQPLRRRLMDDDVPVRARAAEQLAILINSGDEHATSLLGDLSTLRVTENERQILDTALMAQAIRFPFSALSSLSDSSRHHGAVWPLVTWLRGRSPEDAALVSLVQASPLTRQQIRKLLHGDQVPDDYTTGAPELPTESLHARANRLAMEAATSFESQQALLQLGKEDTRAHNVMLEAARRWIPDLIYEASILESARSALKSSSPELRRSGLHLLGEAGVEAHESELQSLLGDPVERVRVDAGCYLLGLGDSEAAVLVAEHLWRKGHIEPTVRMITGLYRRQTPQNPESILRWMEQQGLIHLEKGETNDGK